MCRELNYKEVLKNALKNSLEVSLALYQDLEEEDDFTVRIQLSYTNYIFSCFQELFQPPAIHPSTQFQISISPPDFSIHAVNDIFCSLGPLHVFSYNLSWSHPRSIRLAGPELEDSGLSLQGNKPVAVKEVRNGSTAYVSKMDH